MSHRRAVCFALLASLGLPGWLATPAHADPPAASDKEAGKHFQRGVAMYTEADYRAALVEFRRAYEIAPNAAVLYNIGQTYYQLQNYAAALATLQRYLAEGGASAPHRREVEQTIDTLQSRVGRVTITSNLADCEIAIDDEVVGKTPLGGPQLVSIGHRKVTATHPGVAPQTRFVDVAAGDTVQLAFSLADAGGPAQTPPMAVDRAPQAGGSGRGVTLAWTGTGVLAAGALGAGVWAYLASRDLKDARNTFPVSHDDLASKSTKVTRLAITADVLTAATLVAGFFTVRYTLSRGREVHVAVVPNGVQLAGTFR